MGIIIASRNIAIVIAWCFSQVVLSYNSKKVTWSNKVFARISSGLKPLAASSFCIAAKIWGKCGSSIIFFNLFFWRGVLPNSSDCVMVKNHLSWTSYSYLCLDDKKNSWNKWLSNMYFQIHPRVSWYAKLERRTFQTSFFWQAAIRHSCGRHASRTATAPQFAS